MARAALTALDLRHPGCLLAQRRAGLSALEGVKITLSTDDADEIQAGHSIVTSQTFDHAGGTSKECCYRAWLRPGATQTLTARGLPGA